MTAFTVTMSASVLTYGAQPTDLWNSYNWNAFKWGFGTATIPHKIVMGVNPTNLSVASTAAVNFRLITQLTPQSFLSTATVNFRFSRLASETITSVDKEAHLYLQDRNGYFYVFPEQVIDHTLSTTPNWSSAASTPVSWSTQVATTTTWS